MANVVWPANTGGASFGPDTIIQLPNSAAALTTALELLNEWRVNTAGIEESRWRVFLRRAGVATEAGGFEFPSGGAAMLFIGDLADVVGFRTGHTNMDVLIGGQSPMSFSSTFNSGVTAHFDIICERRLQGSASAGTISVNTLTTGNQNKCRVPGTPSIQGITVSPWTDGARILLYCAATTVLVNNSGAPGSGAAKLLNVSAANITVGAVPRVISYAYDSTDNAWYQEG